MSSYERLAASYDELTEDVDYQRRADFLERLFQRARLPVHTVLDLACGTGTMTWLLTARGYELIAVDGSEDMLAAAAAKTGPGIPPVFLHQSMPQLDLYGTVDAAICCLDSLNYLTNPRDVQRTFERLHLFIAPGGTLIFDVNTPEKFLRLDGQVYLDETEDAYCVWRTEFSRGICSYYVDRVAARGGLYPHPHLRRHEAAPPGRRGAADLFCLREKPELRRTKPNERSYHQSHHLGRARAGGCHLQPRSDRARPSDS